MKTKYLLILSGFALGLLGFSACSNEEPVDEDWCLKPSYKRPFNVHVDIDNSFRKYQTFDTVFSTRSGGVPLALKYYVAAYAGNSDKPLEVSSSFENQVPMQLHPGKYHLVAWADYETETKGGSYNYYTDDFAELLLKNKYSYTGASLAKLGYRGDVHSAIAYTTDSLSITATPVMAQYRLIATDTIAYKPAKVVVYYTSKIPAAINGKDGSFNWWWDDISYTTKPQDSLIATDFVLSQPTETSVTVTVEIYDNDGYMRARKKNLKIPLINGGITTVRGNFRSVLEVDEPAGGTGISIKTEWDDSFDIEI